MKRTALLAILLLLSLLLTACSVPGLTASDADGESGENTEPKNRLFYEYFDTVCVFYDYTGGTDAEFKQRYSMVEAELKACHELFDIYHTYDGINNAKTVNDLAGGEPIKVDERFIELLDFAKDMYDKTSGNVNVMMGSVLTVWHNYRSGFKSCGGCGYDGKIDVFGKTDAQTNKTVEVWICPDCAAENAKADAPAVPSIDKLEALSEHTAIESLKIDREACTVRITDPEASLDLGAVAKGYTCERIARMLEAEGITAYALDFGGNLRVGEKLSGEGWRSGIRNPDILSEEPYIRILDVKNAALVTSGSYERFYTVEGVRYHHIINKDTLMPENRYTSVSILTPSSAEADALSTAFFNMTEDEIRGALPSFPGTEVTLVYPDGRVEVISAD